MDIPFSEDLVGPAEVILRDLILFLPNVITAVVIFFVMLYLSSVAHRAIGTVARRRNVDPELGLLFQLLARWAVIILGLIWALDWVDFNVTGFVAGLGIAGFTIGFALQDIAKNFMAGILLLIQQPFDIGEAVHVSDFDGTITDIEIRATTMRTFDGLLVVIPNADVYSNAIINYSKVNQRRIGIKFGVGYETDLQQANDLVLAMAQDLPGVIHDDPAPFVVFEEFGDSSINGTFYFWIDTAEMGYFGAIDQAVKGIKTAFEREGINIPFPIRTLHMTQMPKLQIAALDDQVQG